MARLLLALGLINPLAFALFAFDARSYVVSIAWAIEAVLLLVAGLALSIRDLRMAALGVFGVVVFKVLVFDLVALSLAVRIITFLAVGGLLLAASFLFARRQRSAARPTPPIPSPGDSPGQGPQR